MMEGWRIGEKLIRTRKQKCYGNVNEEKRD